MERKCLRILLPAHGAVSLGLFRREAEEIILWAQQRNRIAAKSAQATAPLDSRTNRTKFS